MKVLFYGNCQTTGLQKMLNLQDCKQQNILCYSTSLTKTEFDKIIKECDFIITQPITDNYRDLPYLSTSYLINNCNPNCHVIIFDNCYFNFYYFDLTYKKIDGNVLHYPSDYHYNHMIETYKNKEPIEKYVDIVNDPNLKSAEELEEIANKSIEELERRHIQANAFYKIRDNIHIISCHKYIKEKYKEKLLFYSMNHPTKRLLKYVCEKIIKIMNVKNTINYNIDPLDHTKCILYKCIQKIVKFDITESKYKPLTKDMNILKDNKSVYDIAKLYYDTYDRLNVKF